MKLEFQFVALFLDSVDKLLPFLPSVRHKINWEPERSKVVCDRRSKCQLRLYQISVWHSWPERRRLHPNASLRMGESDASGGGGEKWCACATWLGQVRSFLASTCCTRRLAACRREECRSDYRGRTDFPDWAMPSSLALRCPDVTV